MNHEGWLFFLCKGTSQLCIANGVSPQRIFCIRYILWPLACCFSHVWIGATGFLDELGLVWILLSSGFFSSGSNLWFLLLVPTSRFYFRFLLLQLFVDGCYFLSSSR